MRASKAAMPAAKCVTRTKTKRRRVVTPLLATIAVLLSHSSTLAAICATRGKT